MNNAKFSGTPKRFYAILMAESRCKQKKKIINPRTMRENCRNAKILQNSESRAYKGTFATAGWDGGIKVQGNVIKLSKCRDRTIFESHYPAASINAARAPPIVKRPVVRNRSGRSSRVFSMCAHAWTNRFYLFIILHCDVCATLTRSSRSIYCFWGSVLTLGILITIGSCVMLVFGRESNYC